MVAEQDDLVLVRQCLDGDRKGFETLVDKYQRTIFNLALRVTNDCATAEDVAQSAFLKAFEGLKSFNPRYKFFSWLYRITVNEALNAVSQRKQTERLNEEQLLEERGPEETLARNETSDRVQDALMKLKVDHRVVVVLKHFQELSYVEIGQILDIPEKTVKSRLFSARTVLKDILVKKGLDKNA